MQYVLRPWTKLKFPAGTSNQIHLHLFPEGIRLWIFGNEYGYQHVERNQVLHVPAGCADTSLVRSSSKDLGRHGQHDGQKEQQYSRKHDM